MSIRLWLANLIGGPSLASHVSEAKETAVANYKESVPIGLGIDSDEHLYRRAGGRGQTIRRLPDYILNRSRELSFRAWVMNSMARRVIGIIVDYLVGEGVSVDSPHDEVRRVLRRFWLDPVNNMPANLPKRATALYLFGEQHYPVTELEQTGHVRLSYCDPRDIVAVVLDPENAAFACGLVVRRTFGHQETMRLRIVGAEDEFLSNTGREVMREFTDGKAFSFRINCLPNSDRGQPELIAQLDWLDNYEEGLFDFADRVRMLQTFLVWLKVRGADEKILRELEAKLDPASPNSVFATNDAVEELNLLTPDLRGGDKSAAWRLIKNHVLGSLGIPEHFFGEGDSANRATALEMGAPTLKNFTRKQNDLKEMLLGLCTYAVRRALQAGYISSKDIEEETLGDLVQVRFPELSVRDVQKAASAFQSVSQGFMTMVPQGLASIETAVETLVVLYDHIGLAVTAAEEKERVGITKVLDALGPYATYPKVKERLFEMAEAIRTSAGNGRGAD